MDCLGHQARGCEFGVEMLGVPFYPSSNLKDYDKAGNGEDNSPTNALSGDHEGSGQDGCLGIRPTFRKIRDTLAYKPRAELRSGFYSIYEFWRRFDAYHQHIVDAVEVMSG